MVRDIVGLFATVLCLAACVGIGIVWFTPENAYAPTTADVDPVIVTMTFAVPLGFTRYHHSAFSLLYDATSLVSAIPPNVTDDTMLLFELTPTTRSLSVPVPALKFDIVDWSGDAVSVPDVDWMLVSTILLDAAPPLFVVAEAVLDAEPVPAELIADTWYVYKVLAERPVSEYVVAAVPVFGTSIANAPPLVERCIWYPDIVAPPLLAGAVRLRITCDDDVAAADRPVGGPGGVAGAAGVALASFEFADVPTELTAVT